MVDNGVFAFDADELVGGGGAVVGRDVWEVGGGAGRADVGGAGDCLVDVAAFCF